MAHKSDNIDINIVINIVYNKVAFNRTLIKMSQTDMLSKSQVEDIMKSNDFIRQKTYGMLKSRYDMFNLQYSKEFMQVIKTLN